MLPFFDLGLPQGRAIYVLPVPFEGAVSFGTGTCLGPEALFRASVQIESYDAELDLDLGDLAHFLPLPFIDLPEAGPQEIHAAMRSALVHLDLTQDFVLTLGGDHSVPLPLFALYQRAYPDLVILHIDAHADLRPSYEGSPYSHACIIARARDLGLPVVQMGIRSVCRE
ncbi:MAG: agmatinase, partial [Desulfovibrionales bacterium]|nr:agmatinase [Desulfovibrionales bacterium]